MPTPLPSLRSSTCNTLLPFIRQPFSHYFPLHFLKNLLLALRSSANITLQRYY